MPVTVSSPAPYAPASAILEIIRRFRDKGLPTPIGFEQLERAGISESLVQRTLQALKTLDLIDEEGRPTQTLEGLRVASEADYKQRLAQWLNSAYADVLSYLDPETASEIDLTDAFRHYSPPGQRPRMVTLFQGLYGAAGIGPDKDTARRIKRGRPPASSNGNSPSRRAVSGSPSSNVVKPPNPTHAAVDHGSRRHANPYRTAYDALSAIWEPGAMDQDVDTALVTLLRYLRMRETETAAT